MPKPITLSETSMNLLTQYKRRWKVLQRQMKRYPHMDAIDPHFDSARRHYRRAQLEVDIVSRAFAASVIQDQEVANA